MDKHQLPYAEGCYLLSLFPMVGQDIALMYCNYLQRMIHFKNAFVKELHPNYLWIHSFNYRYSQQCRIDGDRFSRYLISLGLNPFSKSTDRTKLLIPVIRFILRLGKNEMIPPLFLRVPSTIAVRSPFLYNVNFIFYAPHQLAKICWPGSYFWVNTLILGHYRLWVAIREYGYSFVTHNRSVLLPATCFVHMWKKQDVDRSTFLSVYGRRIIPMNTNADMILTCLNDMQRRCIHLYAPSQKYSRIFMYLCFL